MSSPEEKLLFEQLTREDGLPSNEVTVITQDSRGFMWFGTVDGLVRYDGYELKVYKNDPNAPESLSSNSVTAIYEDRKGTLWIGTTIGLNKYDRSAETFKSYLSLPNTRDPLQLNDNFIKALFEDRQGFFWIGTQSGGLNLMDRETETFQHYLPDPDYRYGYVSNAITGIVEDAVRPEILWVGTIMNRDLRAQFNTTSRTFTFFPKLISEGKQELARGQINAVFKSKTDQVWIGTANGLDLFLPEENSFFTYYHLPDDPTSLSHDYIRTIYEGSGQSLWVGTMNGGLNKFNPRSRTFSRFRHDPYDLNSLASDEISTIFEDRSGILWVGTAEAGISYVDQRAQKFETIKPNISSLALLNGVSAVYQDREQVLWIGTPRDGLIFLDGNTKGFRHFRDESGDLRMLSKPWVWSILEDRQGLLWIGMNRDGLYCLDRAKKSLKIYKHDPEDPKSLINDYIPAICERRNGTLWIGTNSGLQVFDRDSESFQTISLFQEDIQHPLIGSLYEDHAGNLWVGSSVGLFCLDAAGNILRHLHSDPADARSLSSSVIYCITEDAGHRIWVGTNRGLNKITLTRNEHRVQRYTETDGLASNEISGILEDKRGQLWISTNNGLSLLRNPQQDEQFLPDFHTYSKKDGLQAYRFNAGTFFKGTAGELFFGGRGGLNRFYPDSIRGNTFQPPVAITSFSYYNMDAAEQGAVSVRGITEKQSISLSHQDNIFSIGFAALSFRESHNNKYAYQLEGFTENWIQLGNDHQVTFTNLDPGTYLFRVKGSNNDGLWNETPTELTIIITPPWWKTTWAYLLYALAFLGIIYSWRRYELNRRQLKHDLEIRKIEAEKLQELDQMKSRFFANISHEFRTPLTLILGPLDELIDTPGKKNNSLFILMQRNAQRLLRLINQLLDISKLEAGKMRLEARQQDIIPVIKRMFYAFESLAKHQGVKRQFETEVETAHLYFDPDKLEQVITNILSNAFKFTGAGGSVTVNIREVHAEGPTPSLQIEISDTGTGISAEQLPYVFDRFYQATDRYHRDQQGSGIGLALARELIELHHGRISVRSELGRGSCFTILLPFGKDHLQADQLMEPERGDLLVTDQTQSAASESVSVISPSAPEAVVVPLFTAGAEENAEPSVVLLVEDNTDMRTFIHHQLSGSYQVIEAFDGQDGLEKALETTPDLVISDVMMPRMDGLELCDALKKDERTSHIPLILLTAKADIESRLAGLERGADVYLAKPFNRLELMTQARNLLELRRRLRERYATLKPPAPTEDKSIQVEDAFLQKIRQIIEQHLSDLDLDMDQLSHTLGMSRSQVYRKVKALTGHSPTIYIRSIRLNRAKELLQTTELSVSEIAYEVGFSTLAYFSDTFLEAFGQRPSELRQS